MTKKILICGDSFAVDYGNVTSNAGWANILSKNFETFNYAQAGASEYKILKQIKNINIDMFDAVIISHTSPNRLYVKQHPVHKDSVNHKDSDLIYSVLEYYIQQGFTDKVLTTAKDYFENMFDQEYHEDLYFLIAQEIQRLTDPKPCLHIFTLFDKNYKNFKHHLNLKNQFKIMPGQTNHYSASTNLKIFKLIKEWIDSNHE